MNKSDELFSKFIRNYDMRKKNKILNLDNKIKMLKVKLNTQNEQYNKILEIKENIEEKSIEIDKIYKKLLELLKSRGIIFEITVKNININEWENLHIKLVNGRYKLIRKNGEFVYEIKNKFYNSIEHIVRNYKYSIVVIRKDNYIVKLQLRII
ncbi:hypothetical protein ACSVC9_03980 [Clostridium sp. LBM24168]